MSLSLLWYGVGSVLSEIPTEVKTRNITNFFLCQFRVHYISDKLLLIYDGFGVLFQLYSRHVLSFFGVAYTLWHDVSSSFETTAEDIIEFTLIHKPGRILRESSVAN